MWFDIFVIIFFILMNGIFAASEIAVVTMRRTRIKQLIEEGRPAAKVLYELRNNPQRFLSTIQVGVTLAGVLASAISGAMAIVFIKPLIELIPVSFISQSAEGISVTIVVIIITYFTLIFGELVPKSIAFSNPEAIGLLTAPFINWFSKLSQWVVKFLTISTHVILRPFGKKIFAEKGFVTEEEIRLLLEEGSEQGLIEPEEKELLKSVFEFTDTSVKEVMVPALQMVTIGLNMDANTVKDIISDEKFSRYPVIGKDINDVRGILYAKDFFNILIAGGSVDIRKIIKPPYFVPETMKISILLREMQKKRIHMAMVIDEYGVVSGLVTLEDLLEEIVGEIRDEYDVESPVIQLDDGLFLIDASISIDDLGEDYGIVLPESSEYETLGGFILTKLQKIPVTGDVVNLDNGRLIIVEMVGQRISKVRLEMPSRERNET